MFKGGDNGQETFSLALNEVFLAGVPASVSALGAPCELVDQNGCGKTIAVDDVHAWADAIAELVAQREVLSFWRDRLPLRVEEEAFFYDNSQGSWIITTTIDITKL